MKSLLLVFLSQPTGGWGSIEYGNPAMPGQILGGRWKPLQYMFKQSIFADVMATCAGSGLCYLKNDAPRPFVGRVTLNITEFATGKVDTVLETDVQLGAGAGAMHWFECAAVASAAAAGHKGVLEAIVTASDGTVASSNTVAFATPGEMALRPASLTVSAIKAADTRAANSTAGTRTRMFAEIHGSAVAMYTTLTTLAHGRFADNAFLLNIQAAEHASK